MIQESTAIYDLTPSYNHKLSQKSTPRHRRTCHDTKGSREPTYLCSNFSSSYSRCPPPARTQEDRKKKNPGPAWGIPILLKDQPPRKKHRHCGRRKIA
ncbi:hypothetical protein AVEN_222073-1, partial [Araneus ventricosus]